MRGSGIPTDGQYCLAAGDTHSRIHVYDGAEVDRDDNLGAYVQVWVWVEQSEAVDQQ